MNDLNDFVPCVCEHCRAKLENRKIDLTNTMYFKKGAVPKVCPVCGEEDGVVETVRICLVHSEKTTKVFKASPAAMAQYKGRIKGWKYYCGRSCDEHTRHHIPTHTCDPNCSNCPECLVKYNEALELANTFLRVRT